MRARFAILLPLLLPSSALLAQRPTPTPQRPTGALVGRQPAATSAPTPTPPPPIIATPDLPLPPAVVEAPAPTPSPAPANLNTPATVEFLATSRPISDTELRVGVCNAQSGRTAALGNEVARGTKALFDQINASGGINGRKLVSVIRDDRYEPADCVLQVETLVNDDKVFALSNFVGTPTTSAAANMVREARIPLVGAITGAGALRNPPGRYLFNVRASYGQETEALVAQLTANGITRIGLLLQDDGFGTAVGNGVKQALAKRKLGVAATGTYQRNSLDITDALAALTIPETSPQAIIIGGTYQASAAFLKAANARAYRPTVCAVSFIGTEAFIQAAGFLAEGAIISQVVPSPYDASVPLVKRYQQAIGGSNFTYDSLEGYVNSAVLAEGLQRSGKQLTVETFVDKLENLDADLGGFRVTFTPTSRQGSQAVFLTEVKGSKATPIAAKN